MSSAVAASGAACLLSCAASSKPVSSAAAPETAGKANSGELEADAPMELFQACTPSGPERCLNAIDDNCNGLLEEGCGLPTAVVQFMIAWDKSEADVDLNVTDPNGELIQVGQHAQSGLIKDKDCPSHEACTPQNLEQVYYPKTDAPSGRYRVTVVLEELAGASPPVRIAFGARLGSQTRAAFFELTEPKQQRSFSIEH